MVVLFENAAIAVYLATSALLALFAMVAIPAIAIALFAFHSSHARASAFERLSAARGLARGKAEILVLALLGQVAAIGILLLASAVVGVTLAVGIALVSAVFYALRGQAQGAAVFGAFTVPLNLGLIYGHMLDGWATLIAIRDPFNVGIDAAYGEKHPVSDIFLNQLDGFGFPIIKFAVVALIIYFLDVEYRKELKQDENLVGLVKMAILVLGLAPGLRNFLRMIMAI